MSTDKGPFSIEEQAKVARKMLLDEILCHLKNARIETQNVVVTLKVEEKRG